MEMGMGIVPGWEGRFCERVMGLMGTLASHGMSPVIFLIAFLILPGL
jgi:hypothetical protein